jgi:hypothetical protein
MRILITLAFLLVQVALVSAQVTAGVIQNDDDPYIVKASDGTFYSVEWYSGYSAWSAGNRVYLTGVLGSAEMISRDVDQEVATVWVEELEDD